MHGAGNVKTRDTVLIPTISFIQSLSNTFNSKLWLIYKQISFLIYYQTLFYVYIYSHTIRHTTTTQMDQCAKTQFFAKYVAQVEKWVQLSPFLECKTVVTAWVENIEWTLLPTLFSCLLYLDLVWAWKGCLFVLFRLLSPAPTNLGFIAKRVLSLISGIHINGNNIVFYIKILMNSPSWKTLETLQLEKFFTFIFIP